jgi:hypothetical protein
MKKSLLWMTNTEAGIPTTVAIAILVAEKTGGKN